ncbi:MAG: hypothetical protein BGO69_00410 [Bacteroidetes bacterium 46-16]|nr:MAG: hypothetical protein BGO69_00410 [Bacteroidetes bacterium 46-16]
MKFFPALLLLVIVPFGAYGQNTHAALIDSLHKELHTTKEDSNKVKLLDKLSYAYSTVNPDSGLAYGHRAKTLSQDIKWTKGLAMANADIGINLEARSEHAAALSYDLEALKLCVATGDSNAAAGNIANISLIYLRQGDYPRALEYAFRALTMYEDLDDRPNKAITEENIGTIYFEQKDYPKTIQYYGKAQRTYRELDDKEGVTRNLGNAGIVEDAQGHYTKALQYHMQALEINRASGNAKGTQINLANTGYVYCHMQEYEQALHYQHMALEMSQKTGNDNSMAIDLGNIGETYLAMAKGPAAKAGDVTEAVTYLEKAVSLCRKIKFQGPLIEYSQYLSEAYAMQGNYRSAYETYKSYAAVKDSVFSMEKITQVARLETKRAEQLKDKDLLLKDKQLQIQKLKISEKRNESILYIISIILLVVLVGIALKSIHSYRRSNKLLAQERDRHLTLIEEQIKHIKIRNEVLEEIAHMQAHDIRGPVATILGLSRSFNYENIEDPDNQTVIKGIADVAEKLDDVVKEIIRKKNTLDK